MLDLILCQHIQTHQDCHCQRHTQDTKSLIKEKVTALANFKSINQPQDLIGYKRLTKLVQKAVHKDRQTWIKSDLQPGSFSKAAWVHAISILGQAESSSPSSALINGTMTTNPLKIAQAYTNLLQNKIHELCDMSPKHPTCQPADRLHNWLATQPNPPSNFDLKPIDDTILDKMIDAWQEPAQQYYRRCHH